MLNPKYLLAIASLLVLGASASARADNFPYSVAGLRWSKALPAPADGRKVPGFTNGCVKLNAQKQVVLDKDGSTIYDSSRCSEHDGQVVVADSEAASACANIGGQLPTMGDYQVLIRSFKPDLTQDEGMYYGLHLTADGVAELSKLFGGEDMANWFWSSSLYPNHSEFAFLFNGIYGGVISVNRAIDPPRNMAVRCVRAQ